MIHALQRPEWDGSPVELGDAFVMRRGRRLVTCKVFSHQSGWEVQLVMAPAAAVMLTTACTSEQAVWNTSEQWKAALFEKGWT
jgi:hypothetical protein